MTQFRRWLPLIGVLILAGSTLLRFLGHADIAAALEGAGQLTGANAPPATAEVIAAVVALVGVCIKLYNQLKDSVKP